MLSFRKVVSGFGWVAFSNYLNRILGFGTTLILAKLLTPEHFGLVAAAETMVAILKVVRDLGVGQALIYSKRNDAITRDTAFTMTLALAPVLFLFACVAAPYMAAFLESPDLTPVLIVMSTNIIALTARSVPESLLKKEVEFSKLVAPDAIGAIVASVVGIVLALADFGVWSLVIRTLVFYWIGTALIWRVAPYPLRLQFDWQVAKELFNYSRYVIGAALLFMALYNVDRVFVSKAEGMVALGVYSLAIGLANMPVSEFGHLVCRVIFPVFSKVRDDAEQLRRYLTQAMGAEALVTVPMAVGIYVYGPLLVDLAFGDKWAGLGAALKVLVFHALFRAVSIILHEFLRAIGDPKAVQSTVALRLVVLCAGGWPALQYGGLIGFCWLQVFAGALALLVELAMVKRRVSFSLLAAGKAFVLPITVSLAVIYGTWWVLNAWLGTPGVWWTLAAVVVTVALYFGLLALLARDTLRDLIGQLRAG